ncbi:MAG: hypothetical protein AB2A00_02965 [Myxococcota bacterium]
MTTPGPARTVFAQRAFNLTDVLSEYFVKTVVQGAVPRKVKFVAPEVESTDGGKQARQSIHLVPVEGTDGPFVCGFIDLGAGTAHLRSYASLRSLQQARGTDDLKLDETSYGQFIDELTRKLAEQTIMARLITELVQPRGETAPTTPAVRPAGASMVGTVVAFALGVAVGLAAGFVAWSPDGPLARRPVVKAPATETPEQPAPTP